MIGKILLQQGRSKLTGNCCRLNIRAKRTKRVEKLAMWTIAGLFCRNTLVGSDEMQIAKIQKNWAWNSKSEYTWDATGHEKLDGKNTINFSQESFSDFRWGRDNIISVIEIILEIIFFWPRIRCVNQLLRFHSKDPNIFTWTFLLNPNSTFWKDRHYFLMIVIVLIKKRQFIIWREIYSAQKWSQWLKRNESAGRLAVGKIEDRRAEKKLLFQDGNRFFYQQGGLNEK